MSASEGEAFSHKLTNTNFSLTLVVNSSFRITSVVIFGLVEIPIDRGMRLTVSYCALKRLQNSMKTKTMSNSVTGGEYRILLNNISGFEGYCVIKVVDSSRCNPPKYKCQTAVAQHYKVNRPRKCTAIMMNCMHNTVLHLSKLETPSDPFDL